MFGSSGSPVKDETALEETKSAPNEARKPPDITIPDATDAPAPEKSPAPPPAESPAGRKSGDQSPGGDRKGRRSSGVAKAKEVFSSAKQAFAASPTRSNVSVTQTPLQKLGKTDPALSVPQGSLNNAAGESNPGPRSTFKVGVTEDKNKKCRRTMEDTHAYLYNFLSTPAPSIDPSNALLKRPSSNLDTISSNSSSSAVSHPIVETDNGYFAIFDGHAGTFAAEWCGKKLHILLEDTIRRNPNKAIPELLDETFTSVDQQLDKLPLKNSGCTAVIAVLRWEDRIPNAQSATGSTSIAPAAAAAIAKETSNASADTSQSGADEASTTTASSSKLSPEQVAPAVEAKIREAASRQRVLYTANVGDARIVLCRNGKALRLSYDHKGSDENEGRRIANAGGLILNNRVNGVLAVTRALGDSYMKDLVTSHPYTTETVIQAEMDEFLILACDGLWDVCSDQEAVDLVRQVQDPQAASKILVDHALARFSTDNLSCMIVRLHPAASSSTDPIGVEGDPASSVPEGISETEAIVSSARKNLEGAIAEGVLSSESGEALQRMSTERIVEDAEMEMEAEQAKQEAGPELDEDKLANAREKAKEGQIAAGEAP